MPDYTPEPGEQYSYTPEPGGAYDYTPEPGDLPSRSSGGFGWEVHLLLILFSLLALALAVWATREDDASTGMRSRCQKVLVSSVVGARRSFHESREFHGQET